MLRLARFRYIGNLVLTSQDFSEMPDFRNPLWHLFKELHKEKVLIFLNDQSNSDSLIY